MIPVYPLLFVALGLLIATLSAGASEKGARFPITQKVVIHVPNSEASVRGFGLLAVYGDGGPGAISVERTTTPTPKEPLTPFCVVRVIDSTGKTVSVCELTEQSTPTESFVLEVPPGPAGIWRVSVSGGRDGDRFTIGIPQTETWGLRGEMSLGLTDTLPETMYLYLPRTVTHFYFKSWGDGDDRPELLHHGSDLAALHPVGDHWAVRVDEPPAGDVIGVKLSGCAGRAILFDGTPGLLCPTPEAAKALRGGTEEVAGLIVSGPIQARARRWMLEQDLDDLRVKLDFPKEVSLDLESPRLECLFYGKYGALSSIDSALAAQNLDPEDPFYGAHISAEASAGRPSWDTFHYAGVLSSFDACSLGTIAVTPGRLNPAYGNVAILRRTALSALYHFASLQGDDVIRESPAWEDWSTWPMFDYNYPMIHAFFVYDNLAMGFYLTRDALDPAARAVWRDGLIAVGDKLGDFKAYQSNQFGSMMRGHLFTYLATGEKRFLDYFERMVTAYLNGDFGANAKYGQHPAGYFLEEFGPDANYDGMNMYFTTSMYYLYREIPVAQPQLIEKLRHAIAKDLRFRSFYWLPQPNGSLVCPSAINHRVPGMICGPSYPGDAMAHGEFPLALRRYRMDAIPNYPKVGPASTFPRYARTDAWAMALLEKMLPAAGSAFDLDHTAGHWTAEVHRGLQLPETAEEVKLPIEHERGLWELPGQIAWKEGRLYGLVFFDVAGTGKDRILNGITGGGLSALWTKEWGTVLCSMHNPKNFQKGLDMGDLTFSCVHGEDPDGNLFYSGKERAELEWLEAGRVFAITSRLRNDRGDLRWIYDIKPDAVDITVDLRSPDLREVFVNLPLRLDEMDEIEGPDAGHLVVRRNGATFAVTYPEDLAAELTGNLATMEGHIRCLRIAYPDKGSLTISMGVEAETRE